MALLMASFRSTMAYSICGNLMSCFSLKRVRTTSLTTYFQSTLLPFAQPRAQDDRRGHGNCCQKVSSLPRTRLDLR